MGSNVVLITRTDQEEDRDEKTLLNKCSKDSEAEIECNSISIRQKYFLRSSLPASGAAALVSIFPVVFNFTSH